VREEGRKEGKGERERGRERGEREREEREERGKQEGERGERETRGSKRGQTNEMSHDPREREERDCVRNPRATGCARQLAEYNSGS